jgi:acetylglutamate kinase
MEQSMAKAEVLIEALPYIQRFRDSIVVIKFGGSAMENREAYDGILTDVAFMECVGMKPVIVHGGGSAVSREMAAAGIKPQFIGGMRVTSQDAIDIVERVLANEVSPGIARTLQAKGADARVLRGSEVIHAHQYRPWNEDKTDRLDLGLVGEIDRVETQPILDTIHRNAVPVISPIGRGEDGRLFNINADVAAAEVAIALKARKLVFLSDVHGVRRNSDDPNSFLSTLNVGDVEALIREQAIVGGMMPKVNSGVRAMRSGVQKVHIIDGRISHSLLLEIFTNQGVGTEIVI